MKFAIIQTIDCRRYMSGYTKSFSQFANKLKEKYPLAKFCENLSLAELKNNNLFENGYYIINNEFNFYYIEKSQIDDILNINILDIIHQYELVECVSDKLMNDLNIFNINDIPTYCIVNIIGNKKSKKTCIVASILDRYNVEFIQNTLIISSNNESNNFYKNKYPLAKIMYDYNANEIEKCLKISNPNHDNNGAIILDDCVFVDKYIAELMFNCRKYKKAIIITMKYPVDIKPEFRNNFDCVFMANDNCEINQRRLYYHYFTMFDNFDNFQKVFLSATCENNSWLVLNNCQYPKLLQYISNDDNESDAVICI